MVEQAHTDIRIVNYHSAQLSSVYGLVDLFEKASDLGAEQAGDRIRLIKTGILLPSHWTSVDLPDVLILPPSLTKAHGVNDADDILTEMLLAQHKRGGLICSICAGAFHLARTGLLDGRKATTHWALSDRLAEAHPNIQLEPDKLILDDGDIITAGGVMAWVDLGLRLVDRFLGSAIMTQTARFFLVDPAEREQRYYSGFIPRLTHGDAAILKAQRRLQSHFSENITISGLAADTGLGNRTFMRRFQSATGMRPTEYLQSLRIAKAKELIELTTQTIDAISWHIGYEDASTFRRLFQRKVGLTPREYRRRFSLNSNKETSD